MTRAIDDGAGGIGPWPKRMEAVIGSLLDAVADDPDLSELCLVHGRYGMDAAGPFDPELVQALAGVIRGGRQSGPEPDPGTRAEELVAYGVLAVVAERLRRDEVESLRGLAGELSVLVTMPFLEPGPVPLPAAGR